MMDFKPLKGIGVTPIRRTMFRSNRFSQRDERVKVINYLQNVNVEGMRKHLCFSCAFVTLYDKNNKPYLISRIKTLEQVKAIVEEIIKINQSE
jgi:hypothetical protein